MEVNLISLMQQFDEDHECRAILEDLRWPEGVACPRCQSADLYRANPRKQYDCKSCGYQFSVTSGTIFHDTHLPLPKWFVAIYLMCESKKGISANQMKRTLGVTYKTAWYLCHRIRAAMSDASAEMLKGIVEVDETYVGGKRRSVGSGYKKNKTIVVGAVQRGGPIRLRTETRNDRRALHGFIHAFVDDKAEAIYTDTARAYEGIADDDTRHETVNHTQEEWVRADVHTNTVEGVWSLFKRSIVGSYHQLSAKHMDAYLDEMAWRFNNRKNEYLFRDTLTKLITAETLEYKSLISG
jgi:transposase-like protein